MFWDAARQRWIASVTVGYTPAGKRIYRRASGRTKTEARLKLQQLVRDRDDGHTDAPTRLHRRRRCQDWLDHGLGGRDRVTVETRRILAHRHVIPALGARKLVDLSAEDVDRWLADEGPLASPPAPSRTSSPSCAARSPAPKPATKSPATSSCCAKPRPGRSGGPRRP